TGHRRLDIEVLQHFRSSLKLRIDFEHDAVLIELSEDRVDLALTKSVVKRVVDQLRGNTEARRGIAVNGHERLQTAVLQIAGNVPQFRQSMKLGDEFSDPFIQLARIRV